MAVPKKRRNQDDLQAAKRLVKEAQIKRECGEAAIAAGLLESAIFLAIGAGNIRLAIEAIGHLVLCYLRAYEATSDENYSNLGIGWIELGVGLCSRNKRVPDTYKAVLHLCRGDFHLALFQIDSATRCLIEAVRLIGKKNQARYAEYASHLGLALGFQGGDAGREGLRLLREAERIIRADTKLREYHRLTVLCGILIRKARAANPNNRLELVHPALLEAANIAKKLRDEHGMPGRSSDVMYAARELRVKL